MAPRWLTVPLAVVVLAVAPAALAEKKKDDASAKKDPYKGEDGVRRDPQGVKGISPFWESLKKGDAAFAARDFDAAIAAYKEAITKEPQNALGFYRLGEAQLAKGDQQEAEAAWVSALRFANDPPLKAKVMHVLADLRERQKAYDDATDRWNAYEKYGTEQSQAKAYPATPVDRKKRITEWKRLVEEGAQVKARIEKRLKEAGPPKP